MAVFNADHLAAEQAKEGRVFTFLWEGEEYELPSWRDLTPRKIKDLGLADEREYAIEDLLAIIRTLSEDAAEAISDMPLDVVTPLLQSWQRTGGEPGKARPSPSRSHSSKKPKRGKPPRRT
jgi:hypothetical protein